MLFSKEYVAYLARELTKKLVSGEFIESKEIPEVTARVQTALHDELATASTTRYARFWIPTRKTCGAPAPTTRRCSRR
jgi:hypothetical protein